MCAVLLARSLLAFRRSFPLSAHLPSRLPLLRFSKDRPSAVCLRESSPSSPSRRMVHLRPSVAKHRTPSALVVPPDSDGLLLTKPRRFIAPCIQPWGSSRFQPRLQPPVSRPVAVLVAFPVLALHTLRSVPLIDSQLASPQPFASALLARCFHRCSPHRNASCRCFRSRRVPAHSCCHQCALSLRPLLNLEALLHR